MNLGRKLSDFWGRFQGELFPALSEEVGPLLGDAPPFCSSARSRRRGRLCGGAGGRSGSSSRGPSCPCAGLSGQGGMGPSDDAAPDRQAWGGPVAAAVVRLAAPRGYPERGDLFAGVCGVCRGVPGGQDARGVGGRCAGRGAHRPCVAGLYRHRGSGGGGCEAEEGREAEAPARSPAQKPAPGLFRGRGEAEDADPPRTAGGRHEPQGDARRPSEGLRPGHEEERPRHPGDLARLQAPCRHGRLRHTAQRHPHLGLPPPTPRPPFPWPP